MAIDEELYKDINGKLSVSTNELCEQLGIARKTLTEWEEKGCPKSCRGWWPLWDVLKWRGLVGNGLKTEDELAEEYVMAKKLKYEAELKKQKAEEATFNNAVARGEYLRKDEITSELQRFFVILKRSMLGYSRKIANELASVLDPLMVRRIEKMITELTMDALGQFSIDGVYTATKKKKEA